MLLKKGSFLIIYKNYTYYFNFKEQFAIVNNKKNALVQYNTHIWPIFIDVANG
jgi:hypothetical protein